MITQSTYRVSVVVPTYKRPDLLMRCLQALFVQDIDAHSYEVIIADDAAWNETRQMVESWAEQVQKCGNSVRYVPVTGAHGPAAARNAGWRAALGEIIAFTDDDCIPVPGWLRAGLSAFTAGVVGVSGQLLVPLRDKPTDYERNAAHLADAEFVTANCFYRRAALEAIGGFDERFSVAWREDSDLIFTLYQHHCYGNSAHLSNGQAPFVHAPAAIVIHPIRPARWGISLSQQRKSMFNALLYKKHPRLYREKIQAAPPWHYYAIVGALMAFMAGLLGGSQRLSFVAACLWLFLTGRFCLRRLQKTSARPEHRAEMLVTSALIPPLAIFWRIVGAIKFRVLFF